MARRKRYLFAAIGCSLTAVLCAALAVSSNRPESSVSTITVSPANGVFDFGSVGQGNYSGTFVLQNPTPELIRIVGVKASCSCTVANVKEDVIPSGGAIELDFEWDTVGLGGSIQKPILLSFQGDESSTPWTQELLIAGDVLPDFEYSPFLVTFEAGEDATRTIQFSPIGDPDFRIRGAYCVHRAFDVAVDETRRSVTVSFDSDRWREFSRNVNVVVQTNCKTSSVGIPIRVESRKMSTILNVDLSQ